MSWSSALSPRSGAAVPLAPGYLEAPLWWDDAQFPDPADADLPASVDVVIVGAGYTGIAAALELCRRGRSALVLDKAPLGHGASGRNAGMVHAGLRYDVAALERRHGSLGRALHDVSVDAHRFVAQLAPQVAPDAGYAANGWLYLAHSRAKLRALREGDDSRRARGETTQVYDAAGLEAESACLGFHGGLATDNGAQLHPARYLAGMARAAIAAGAQIRERCAVTRCAAQDGCFRVDTERGTVTARDVLVAANGYIDAAFPRLRRSVIPIGSYIIATEPLGSERAATVTKRGRVLSDTRNFLHYWRLSPDRRLVFGGRTSFTPVSLGRARDRLYAAMLRMYPQLAGVQVTHAWGGNVGFTFDRLPHMGRIDGVTYAMGYCGSGVAMGSWFGTLAAAWIAEGKRNPFLRLKFPTAPGYTGTPWFLPAVGWYYQLRDRIG